MVSAILILGGQSFLARLRMDGVSIQGTDSIPPFVVAVREGRWCNFYESPLIVFTLAL